MINKKDLSERDICSKYINPSLEKAEITTQKRVCESWIQSVVRKVFD